MKIFFDFNIMYFQKYGGISRYICEISKNLKISNKIVAPIFINKYLKESDSVFGCYLGKNLKFSNNVLKFLNILISEIYFFINNPDIIHETYYSEYGVGGRKTLRVLTVHDMIHEKFPHCFDVKDNTSFKKRKAVSRADHIICISNSTKADLIEIFNIPENKISVIYHGVNKLNLPSNFVDINLSEPYLLYVGMRGGYKNFEILLKVFIEYKEINENFKLVLFGGEDLTLDEKIYYDDLGILEKIVIFKGSDAILAQLYKNAEVFVYPSLYEGFGFPPLEAMSLSCPVVASNTSSIPEIVGDAALLFDPHNFEDLYEKLECILKSSTIRNDLIAKGLKRADFFSWEKCAFETEKVYDMLKLYK